MYKPWFDTGWSFDSRKEEEFCILDFPRSSKRIFQAICYEYASQYKITPDCSQLIFKLHRGFYKFEGEWCGRYLSSTCWYRTLRCHIGSFHRWLHRHWASEICENCNSKAETCFILYRYWLSQIESFRGRKKTRFSRDVVFLEWSCVVFIANLRHFCIILCMGRYCHPNFDPRIGFPFLFPCFLCFSTDFP